MSLTQDQVATLSNGLTSRRIRQLEKEGRGCERNPDGSYDELLVGQWLRERVLEEIGVSRDGKSYDYNAERARLTKAQADKTELEVRELRGDMISVSKALIQVEAMIAGMRAKLLNLPAKAAAAVTTNPLELAKAQEVIRVQVYEALEDMASDRFQAEIDQRIKTMSQTKSEDRADRKGARKRGPSTRLRD